MGKIQPTYVTFEQAKLINEKGLKLDTDASWWILAKDHLENYKKGLPVDESKIFFAANCEEFENKTEIDQEFFHETYHVLNCPEQWQVVEFLRVEKGIWVEVTRVKMNLKYSDKRVHIVDGFECVVVDDKNTQDVGYNPDNHFQGGETIGTEALRINIWKTQGNRIFSFSQEAYSAAFDYVLNNLI